MGEMAQHQTNEYDSNGPVYTQTLANYEKVRIHGLLIHMWNLLTLSYVWAVQLHSPTSATGFTGFQQDLCLVLLPSNILHQCTILDLEYSLDDYRRSLGSLVFLRHGIPMQRPYYALVDF